MYLAEEGLAGALDSLLSQDYGDYAVIAIDDCSPDATFAIASEYARSDERLLVDRNTKRLGMIGNWNRVLARTRELHGDFEFFAWASDNDRREPSWLSTLVRALEENPAAILAYSRFGVIEDGEKIAPPGRWLFETRGIRPPFERLRVALPGLRAGPIMYGLHRRRSLDESGDVPHVLFSDRLFLSYLCLYGEFLQEPQVLWYRGTHRVTGASIRRQRAALFADHPPVSTYLPISWQHTLWLLRRTVLGRQRPRGIGRLAALGISVYYLWWWWSTLVRRWSEPARKKVRRKHRVVVRGSARSRKNLQKRILRGVRVRRASLLRRWAAVLALNKRARRWRWKQGKAFRRWLRGILKTTRRWPAALGRKANRPAKPPAEQQLPAKTKKGKPKTKDR
jgi:glycosyltransferase involved in cell wall biosynthesis